MTGWLSAVGREGVGLRMTTRPWAQQLRGWWCYLPCDRTLEEEQEGKSRRLHFAESSKHPCGAVHVNSWIVWSGERFGHHPCVDGN